MEDKKVFRYAFFITFSNLFLLFTIIMLIDEGLDLNVIAYLGGSAFVLIATYFMILYYKITISSDGIKGIDFWGLYHFIEWEWIIEVKPIRIIGLKFVRLVNTEKRPIWLPLFLSDMDKFKAEIKKNVPQNNPLNRFFDLYA